MCGIAGFVGSSWPEDHSRAVLEEMCDAIRHRGPDDAGYFVAPGAAIGMRRLSIIDVDGGHQPIGNEDGRIHIVFNGEIYNYRELRADLLRRGHRFTTNTDTETILHLYEERGDQVVQELRGMFGFGIWDGRRQRLLVARDRVGIKPIYYRETSQGVAFASELKSLLRMPDAPREVDRDAVADYLALGYVPEPACAYAGVRKLEPAHVLTWERGRGVEVARYWSPFRPEDTALDEVQAVEEIRRLLSESVRYRLISDVPLGAFLSGGLDSSAVVAEMGRQMDRPVQTFTIGFDEPEFNEAPHAAAVARELRTQHTELVMRPDIDELIEPLVHAFDEPFADSSAIPTFLVSRLAREQVKVVLSGDGGDELFGGYSRYLDLMRRDVTLPGPARAMVGALARRLPHGARGRNRLLELSRGAGGRYAGMVAYPLSTKEGGVALPDQASDHALEHLLDRWFRMAPDRSLPVSASFVDLLSYLPGDILTKVDRMSMAASLEARVPLLDHHMVEFASTVPASLRFRDGVGKWIFRQAIRDRVPDLVLTKRKQGFGIPLRLWFRNELRDRVESLLRTDAPIYEYVDRAAVARIVREHRLERRDHSPMIWRLLVLQIWLQSAAATRFHRLEPVALEVGR